MNENDKQKYIYDSTDFYEKWDRLIESATKSREQRGKDFDPKIYDTSLAIAVLSFYGLTGDEILSLKLEDVTDSGIRGFDIDFDERSLEFLKEYKYADGFTKSNGNVVHPIPYKQNTFIRSTHQKPVSKNTIKDSFNYEKIRLLPDDSWLRDLFKVSNLESAGKFCRLYAILEEENVELTCMKDSVYTHLPPDLKARICFVLGYGSNVQTNTIVQKLRRFFTYYYVPRKKHEEKLKEEQMLKGNPKLLKEALTRRVKQMRTELDSIQKLIDLLAK